MDLGSTTYSQLVEPVQSQETQPLLSHSQSIGITFRERLARANFVPRQLCLPSKAAVLILFWSLLVGAIYMIAKEGTDFAADLLGQQKLKFFHSYDILLTRFIFVLIFVLYPFAGFLADVCCGRYKVIIISLCLLACGVACLSVDSIFFFTKSTVTPFYKHRHRGVAQFYVFAIGGAFFLILGFSGYKANFIQFGIDQLTEAPSEYLGLFVHWTEWFTMLGSTFAQTVFSLIHHCDRDHSSFIYHMTLSLPLLFLALLLVMLVFTYWKRHWFNIEPARSNPYKTVIKVLNFARKHKHPLQRSAFTYTDDEEPTRIDFAKERFGGPFTTEQVEDVKTFLRVLVILLALGPVFATEVPIGPLLLIFMNHIVKKESTICSKTNILLDASILKSLATVVLFPVYIWFIYSVLRQCIPRTFTRIKIGVVTLMAGLLSMLLIELLGHLLYHQHHRHGVMCMFRQPNHLDLHWAVNLVPGFLTQTGFSVIITTTFEFISAQSPHSMKGLLIGVMFAVRGTFQVFIAIGILPFSVNTIWGTKKMKDNPPPIVNCGFGYLLFTCTFALVGLVLFLVAVKRYRYRERDDPPYNQMAVERVWANN